MKFIAKLVAGLLAVVVLAVAGLAVYIGTIDADKYRPKITETLTEKTGRAIKLEGPIEFRLGLGSVKASMSEASIGNPVWASRPVLAKLGHFEVEVGLLPLLSKTIVVQSLTVENADILLETNAAGKNNWDFTEVSAAAAQPAPSEKKAPVAAKSDAKAAMPALSVGKLTILNSRISTRAADAKTSTYNVSSLSMETKGRDVVMKFDGNAAGTAVKISARTGAANLLTQAAFPFEADVSLDALKISFKGTADIGASRADIAQFRVVRGTTDLTGKASAAWGGSKPVLRGELYAARVDLNDFGNTEEEAAKAAEEKPGKAAQPQTHATHMFGDTPLPLDALRAVDADFTARADKLIVKRGTLEKAEARLVVNNGILTMSPLRAMIGSGTASVQFRLDASQSPARLSLALNATDADLGELQKLGDMTPFLRGKSGANVQLSAVGNTPHALASTTSGVITVTADKGEILGSAVSGVSSTLAAIFNPGGGDSAINCLAVRFIAKGGILTDNGVLIDSMPTTLAGRGHINLGAETLDLTLNARTKLVDIGFFVPTLKVSGSFADPGYAVDAVSGVKNVVGSLIGGSAAVTNANVPEIQNVSGQNACVYTLDHPKAATPASPAQQLNNAGKAIETIGNTLTKGLFGK